MAGEKEKLQSNNFSFFENEIKKECFKKLTKKPAFVFPPHGGVAAHTHIRPGAQIQVSVAKAITILARNVTPLRKAVVVFD